MAERFLSTRDVVRTLGVSPTTVQVMVEKGVLKAWRTSGGHRRISEASVQAMSALCHLLEMPSALASEMPPKSGPAQRSQS